MENNGFKIIDILEQSSVKSSNKDFYVIKRFLILENEENLKLRIEIPEDQWYSRIKISLKELTLIGFENCEFEIEEESLLNNSKTLLGEKKASFIILSGRAGMIIKFPIQTELEIYEG